MSKLSTLKSRLAWRFVEHRIRVSTAPSIEHRQPVFLLFTPRAGSKHFLALLDSIPGASFDYEILGSVSEHASRMYFGAFRKTARKLISARVQRLKTGPHFLRASFGAPIFSSKSLCLSYISQCLAALDGPICAAKFQFEHFGLGGISPADLHEAFPNAKFVLLYRRSMSRQLISDVLRHVTKDPSLRAGREYYETRRTIRLTPAKIRPYFESVRAINEEWMSLPFLADHGAVVCYEDLCEDPQRTFERSIFPLLDLSPTPVADRRFQKQTNRPIEEIVENYDEVSDLLNAVESIQEFSTSTAAGRAPHPA